jgi:hypothetical protein
MHSARALGELEMQGPTHLLIGMLIQKVFMRARFPVVSDFFIVLLAFLSHGILDGLARFTYHPPEPIANQFWISFHLIVSVMTIYIFVRYWKTYKLSLFFFDTSGS